MSHATQLGIIHLMQLPMLVLGMAVFSVGLFFFARLLLFVRIPFALQPSQQTTEVVRKAASYVNTGG